MSVTFTTEMSAITGYTIGCGNPFCENRMTDHSFTTYAAAEAFLQGELDTYGCTGHLAVCGDNYCQAMRMSIHLIEEAPAPQVGCSESNARYLLQILGAESDEHGAIDLCGSATGEDFMGRVLMASALTPADEGVPSYDERGEGGMTMVMCGRRAGWTEDYLEGLRELAEFSIATGRAVQWA